MCRHVGVGVRHASARLIAIAMGLDLDLRLSGETRPQTRDMRPQTGDLGLEKRTGQRRETADPKGRAYLHFSVAVRLVLLRDERFDTREPLIRDTNPTNRRDAA